MGCDARQYKIDLNPITTMLSGPQYTYRSINISMHLRCDQASEHHNYEVSPVSIVYMLPLLYTIVMYLVAMQRMSCARKKPTAQEVSDIMQKNRLALATECFSSLSWSKASALKKTQVPIEFEASAVERFDFMPEDIRYVFMSSLRFLDLLCLALVSKRNHHHVSFFLKRRAAPTLGLSLKEEHPPLAIMVYFYAHQRQLAGLEAVKAPHDVWVKLITPLINQYTADKHPLDSKKAGQLLRDMVALVVMVAGQLDVRFIMALVVFVVSAKVESVWAPSSHQKSLMCSFMSAAYVWQCFDQHPASSLALPMVSLLPSCIKVWSDHRHDGALRAAVKEAFSWKPPLFSGLVATKGATAGTTRHAEQGNTV